MCFLLVLSSPPMRLPWRTSLRSFLVIGLMSGLVACGSLANCFNSGFAPVACGGGYGERDVYSLPLSTATSTEGRWTGSTSTGRTLAGIVLEDGSYWLFYSAIGHPHILAGLVHGTGTSHSGSFGSSNTRDFKLEGAGIRAATMRGSYVPNKSFQGTIAYFTGEEESFTSKYDANSATLSNLSQVAGTYTGVPTGNHSGTVTLDATGRLSGHATDGCTVAGTLSPRTKGNVFHTSVTLEGATCHAQTETLTGVAWYDAATRRLYSVALNPPRTTSFLFLGSKQ